MSSPHSLKPLTLWPDSPSMSSTVTMATKSPSTSMYALPPFSRGLSLKASVCAESTKGSVFSKPILMSGESTNLLSGSISSKSSSPSEGIDAALVDSYIFNISSSETDVGDMLSEWI